MTLTVSLGLVGLVVDEGWAYWRSEACLTAAQAASSAAALYANANNTTWPPASCTTGTAISCNSSGTTCPSTTTLGTAATSVVDAACKYAKVNGYTASGNQNVIVSTNTGSPPTVSGVTTAYYVTVRVAEMVPLTFLAPIVGRTSNMVSASSTAAVISSAPGSCVYVLDPSDSKALYATNGVTVNSECGYWVFSSSSTGTWVEGGSQLKAISSSAVNINTAGNYTTPNGGAISPTPVKGAPVADPFISRNVPLERAATGGRTYNCSYGTTGGCAHTSNAAYTCDHTNYVANTGGSNVTLTPGVYCGTGGSPAISIGNVNNVTFNSGVYILDGGGMNLGGIGGIARVTAAGVCFFNTGTNATYKGVIIGNGVPTTAIPEASGSMAGLLVYQDPSLSPGVSTTTDSKFEGGSALTISGSIYLPTTRMLFANGTSTTTSTALVVYQVQFDGGAYFKKDGTNITGLGGANKIGLLQ